MLEAIVTRLPPPQGDETAPLKALLVDSWYDAYLGVVVLVRVIDGTLKKGQKIRMMGTDAHYEVDKIGVFRPEDAGRARRSAPARSASSPRRSSRWPTPASATPSPTSARPAPRPLPGFKPAQPVVFCGLFPVDAADFEDLRAAMGKLRLNDASFSYEMETSAALGFGFRCGFLGLLHLEIIQERLEREFNLDLIATAPSVVYQIKLTDGDEIELHNPADMPDVVKIEEIEEPWIRATILTPDDYLGAVLKLCQDRRGVQVDLNYVGKRAMAVYDLPLNEVVFDFYDRLKSISKGYACFDYQHHRLSRRRSREDVDPGQRRAGRRAVHAGASHARREARPRRCARSCKELIPPHMFQIPIQAAIGGKIIARETVRALRKDVTAKCYGGDVTRKRKLLEKQKEGKKKMRQFGGRDPAGSLHRRAEDGRLEAADLIMQAAPG